ncbi:hypothetical protein DL96DRAFT_1490076 [Flagelloscypha sp. PMI_526]|nr:hypothetical protein DL96DRAFT_1490076 [Flagelloscypha sp. PMI_526]
MRAAPSKSSRSDYVLQPSYFSSGIYVSAAREDFLSLLSQFHAKWTGPDSGCPFAAFKEVWTSQGWPWLSLQAIDDRAREAFFNSMFRIFMERVAKSEAAITRVLALFSLYTFYYSQPLPSETIPRLRNATHIPVPIDRYNILLSLPGSLTTPYLQPFQSYTAYILNTLVEDNVFLHLPRSELAAQNPPAFPRVSVVHGNEPSTKALKAGRPTKRDMAARAQTAVDGLNSILASPLRPAPVSIGQHITDNELALAASDPGVVQDARAHVQARLRELTSGDGV